MMTNSKRCESFIDLASRDIMCNKEVVRHGKVIDEVTGEREGPYHHADGVNTPHTGSFDGIFSYPDEHSSGKVVTVFLRWD
jgi:hypothetical protein